jgi:hypothetical protein
VRLKELALCFVRVGPGAPSSPVRLLSGPSVALSQHRLEEGGGGLAAWAVCRLDGMSPLAHVRKLAGSQSPLPIYEGRGRNLGISLRLGLSAMWYG